MSETSASSNPAGYRLETFGTLALAGPGDDTLLGKHGHHRRRLALLAVLAAAGERGRSRDQLLLLFWPEATQSRARHSLDQLLYALRGALGESAFDGPNPVRLNADIVSSDVGVFNSALARGDLDAAVAEYRGPFLDGFHLDDAPEFEQWVESERARLTGSYSAALERLAQSAEAAQDHATAVRWWRKLTEADPVSSKNATGLIRALMNAGDHAAALQYAERYEAVVAKELGTSVGPAVAGLVAEVRAEAKTESLAGMKAVPLPNAKARTAPLADWALPFSPEQVRSPRRRSVPYVIGALVTVALVIAAVWLWWLLPNEARPGDATEPSIAVLPFANVSQDPHDATIMDGLGEELIAVLAKIPNLRVIARTSALAFKDSELGVRRIADSLGVSHILEGSVQKSGTQLRVQVRVVAARDETAIWSETYNRELRDVFQVQDDIARSVARELGVRLNASPREPLRRLPTQSVEAYELYLRGSDRTLMRSDSAAHVGLEYFRRAVALDSSFAAAWAFLGRMYNRTAPESSLSDRERHYALADHAIRKALALDDSLSEAHVAFAGSRMRSFDFISAERHFNRAIALDPTYSQPHEFLVTLYLWTERPAEALAHGQHALELEPLSPYARVELARALLGNDRCDEALPHLEQLLRLQPPFPRAVHMAALCYARKQMWTEGLTLMRAQAARNARGASGLLGYLLARSGNRSEAIRMEAALRQRWGRGHGVAYQLAWLHAGLGNFDQVFIWLDRAIEDRSLLGAPGSPEHVAIMGPLFQDLRRDPRFERFRQRLGLQKR